MLKSIVFPAYLHALLNSMDNMSAFSGTLDFSLWKSPLPKKKKKVSLVFLKISFTFLIKYCYLIFKWNFLNLQFTSIIRNPIWYKCFRALTGVCYSLSLFKNEGKRLCDIETGINWMAVVHTFTHTHKHTKSLTSNDIQLQAFWSCTGKACCSQHLWLTLVRHFPPVAVNIDWQWYFFFSRVDWNICFEWYILPCELERNIWAAGH